jgi:hypothetical protein
MASAGQTSANNDKRKLSASQLAALKQAVKVGTPVGIPLWISISLGA